MQSNRIFALSLMQIRSYTKVASQKKTNLIRTKPKKPTKPIKPIDANRVPLITCKRPEFNLYRDDVINPNKKFGEIPLASDGWQHYKSKDDFFVIHPYMNVNTESSKYAIPFNRFGFDDELIRNLRFRLNIEETTYIQHEAMPRVLAGDHTLIAAETGCGKTIAYLLPIVQNILKQKRNGYHVDGFNLPMALILTPGRELAEQIGTVARELCEGLGIKVDVMIGGSTKQKMINPKMKETDILVGSTGVVSKLVTNGIYRMNEVRHVVLDEFDTLLDDSFLGRVAYFLKKFPFYKNIRENNPYEVSTQLVMATATMPQNRDDLLHHVIDPETVYEIVSPNLHKILPHVKQTFHRTRKNERPMKLLKLIRKDLDKRRPVIVFGNKTATSDYVSIILNENGIGAVSLNGDLLKVVRDGQFSKFQEGEVNVLSTTDLASRGLDTKRACHIINFDFPMNVNDYIHRCGRIGRVGSADKCCVTNLITSLSELPLVRQIEHTARTQGILPNVDANVTGILLKKQLGTEHYNEVKSRQLEEVNSDDEFEKPE